MLAQGLGQGGGHPPVAGHIQHVQLGCVGKLGWQNGQAVVPQGEDAECCAPSDLGRQHLQAVPVHVEVGQLGEPPKGAGQGRQQVLCEDQLRQVLTVPDGFGHFAQTVLVCLQDGQLLQLTWCWGDAKTSLRG